ncbi:hypothetical protein [Amycolatopsis thermophila]|uniref:Uncharacterized protein n=1 Tax=Amycolatopsis thermophila TaxID=206084 RepID=A0ABU0F5G4_9PSEU|nr:hypothetical protein [Amycolatopsis thermophila]MDQ0382830.1 hypothetical protein [Amycolatopsis thermophila]
MSTTSVTEDFSQLRADCEFRAEVHDERYRVREAIGVGEWLYDPQLRFATADGAVVLSDIGGQPERGFDPTAGHGAIYRFTADDRLETISPPGMHGVTAPLRPEQAPPWFGGWGGHLFFIAQAESGRVGAHKGHRLYRMDPADGIPHAFADLPHHGPVGDGVPGAGMTGTFGPKGSPHEGYLFCQSLVNCVVYRVDPDGNAEPYLVMAPPLVERPMMPFLTFVAPDHSQWRDVAGEVIIATRATTYLEHGEAKTDLQYWRIDDSDRSVHPVPGIQWRAGPIAPEGFGPYAGHMFTVDEGSTNLLHASINELNAKPLPYDARILRIAPDGSEHVFVDGIQGGSTTLVFAGNRLVAASSRKSYSTGEYHEPDGSIFVVEPVGS